MTVSLPFRWRISLFRKPTEAEITALIHKLVQDADDRQTPIPSDLNVTYTLTKEPRK